MKKLLLTLALSTAALFTFAQLPTFGIKAGVNSAKISASQGDISVSTGYLTSFHAGAFVDFKLGAVSLQPALYYSGKGGKFDDGDGTVYKTSLYYVQVPVNIVYHIPAVIGSVYLGAGPYAAFGVSAKDKYTSGGQTVSQDLSFGDDSEEIKRTDFGINGIAGFQFKGGFLVGLNYDLGLSNISNSSMASTKNRVLGVSVGFTF